MHEIASCPANRNFVDLCARRARGRCRRCTFFCRRRSQGRCGRRPLRRRQSSCHGADGRSDQDLRRRRSAALGRPRSLPIHTTKSTEAQRYFDQGLRWAANFNHAEARRAFRKAQRLDPTCAMCFVGEALVLGPNINVPMDPEANAPAIAALRKAHAKPRCGGSRAAASRSRG